MNDEKDNSVVRMPKRGEEIGALGLTNLALDLNYGGLQSESISISDPV